ncbi:MAG: hypothetical protein HY874_12080 [Chloroflexi bacterium]|nr:hypothetical protein [Chloroflexota bacterium]
MFFRVIAGLTLAVAALGLGLRLAPPAQTAIGGPVILGGDDLTDHGGTNGGGDLYDGWLYIQRALESIGPDVTRSNDDSIAALGSEFSENTSSDAGAAIGYAADVIGRDVTYYEGPVELADFFADLASGATDPAIIWIAGTGASNDLDEDEEAVITANADALADFVSEGGGLMSHGSYYDWLFALLPDATAVGGGSSDDLYFTADGLTDLPALSETDINSGPWHNHFEGDLGGLKVLVRSSTVLDIDDNDAAVIIGGSQVTFVAQPDTPVSAQATPCIQGIVNSRCPANPPVSQVTPVATATAVPPTAVPATSVPPAAVPTRPGGGAAGVISAPDTGTGPGGSSGGNSAMLMSLGLLAAGLAASGAALGLRRR